MFNIIFFLYWYVYVYNTICIYNETQESMYLYMELMLHLLPHVVTLFHNMRK